MKATASVNLIRIDGQKDKPTMGCLSFGGVEFASLEPAEINPFHSGHPCIPKGTYKLVLATSPSKGQDTPHLLDVPNRSNILIHSGNTQNDTLGCILLGITRSAYTVQDSRKAMDTLKTWCKQNEADNRPMQIVIL